MASIAFFLNGEPLVLEVEPSTPLLDVLREDLGLTGTKQGCDHEGECGACTVLLDGQPVRACLTPVGKVAERSVCTIEGIGGDGRLTPLQDAFIEVGAVQCGYCTPGMILASHALLERETHPTREQIVEALDGNLCRCTGYTRIVAAVQLAASRLRGEDVVLPPVSEKPLIGGDIRRLDSIGKVTGHTKYVEDIVMPGMLHAKTLRSPYPHARLVSLYVKPATALRGVVRVLTAEDIPGENGLGDYSQNDPVLTPVGGTLKMIGAPIALVIAETPDDAQLGIEAIQVEYEQLPHTFDVNEALEEDAFPIYDKGNVLTSDRVAHGDLDAAFAQSDVVIETRYRTAYLEHAALEREAMLGYIDEVGRVTVKGATHEPHWHQGYIAATLALDPDRVRFVTAPIGGSFGGKQDPWPAVAAGLAVYHVQAPVRLVYSRRESFDFSPKRHPYQIDYHIGATKAGHLTGIQVRIDANTGGYDAHGQYIPDYAITASGGPYRWQAVDAYAQTVYTNGPKAGQFRGFGTAQSVFALECTLDELAMRLGVDPLEFRMKNAIEQSSISFLGYPVAESLGFADVLAEIRPRYSSFLEEAQEFNAVARSGGENKIFRKGIGLSGMWYRFGKSGSLRIEAHAELATDGHFVVYCSAPDYGQGTNTMLSQFAAKTLGISRDRIELVNADTALTPDSGIQGASRSTYFVGGAVCEAARNLRVAIDATASELLNCAPSELVLADEYIMCQHDAANRVSLRQVAQEFEHMGRPRRVPGIFDLSRHFPQETRPLYVPLFVTGAQLAEVIVNLQTGVVQVLRVVAVHDVGRAINPVDVEGQIEGSILMGLGAAFLEEIIPGKSTGFGDYYLPTIKSMPEIETILVEVPSFLGPEGAKGLAEASMLPSTPAMINAVCRAIGGRIRELPATPERVLQAIRANPEPTIGR
jgi:aldehyde oxidoreductase